MERIPPVKHDRLTDTTRAAAAGTNRKYLKDAEKIVSTRPDLAEKIEQGKLTIPQAVAEIKRAELDEEYQKAIAATEAAQKKGGRPKTGTNNCTGKK